MAWRIAGVTIVDPEQVVIESDPYRRLAYTWHTFTPEWAARVASTRRCARSSPPSAVRRSRSTSKTLGEAVKLTVLHGNFEAGSTVATMVRDGWPRVVVRPQDAPRDRRASCSHQLTVRTTTTFAGREGRRPRHGDRPRRTTSSRCPRASGALRSRHSSRSRHSASRARTASAAGSRSLRAGPVGPPSSSHAPVDGGRRARRTAA